MQITSAINQTRYEVFRWRCQASLPWKITLAVLMAGLTGLLAQIRIPLPFTPVPVTGQTFGVLLAGVLLGRKWGGASLAIYAIAGIAGMPWFNGATSGLGTTTGYLVGFVLAALFLGYVTDRNPRFRTFGKLFGLMLFASLVLIYIPGLIWLGFWLHAVQGSSMSVAEILTIGALPFIAGDVLKTGAAALTARVITPGEPFSD